MESCIVSVPGTLWANGYLLWNGKTREALAVDPDATGGVLETLLEQKGLTLVGLLLTHGNFAHIASLALLKSRHPGAKLYIHREDAAMLTEPRRNLSVWQGQAITAPAADVLLEDGDGISLGGEMIRVLHTPGHTPGSVCYRAGEELFAGDTLFAGSVGRWDFPGGDGQQLITSISRKLLSLPDETRVFPGHGPATTIGRERRSNPYLESKL